MWKKAAIGIGTIGLICLISLICNKVFFNKNTLKILSPLADNFEEKRKLKIIFDKKTRDNFSNNIYYPIGLIAKYQDNLEINAKSYCVYDRDTREILIAKNLDTELPIASVTKIMTAVVALERASLDVDLKVSSSAAAIGEAVMGLSSGEILTVEELLYGLMLPSGNDAAETLAEGLGKGRTNFILNMNQKAEELGLFDTYYFNPTGLDGDTIDKTTFSTCLDQLVLTNYALNNKIFAKIVSTRYKELPYKIDRHKAFYLNNILSFDRSYPGVKGVKPGVTDFAQETLVSYAENGNKKIIAVLLGTENSKDEVIKLYDFIFGKMGIKVK